MSEFVVGGVYKLVVWNGHVYLTSVVRVECTCTHFRNDGEAPIRMVLF